MSSGGFSNNACSTNACLAGGDRGKMVKRGTTLSFPDDSQEGLNAEGKLDSGGSALVLNGNDWLKQR